MTLKVATATGCEGEKGIIIMRIPYLDMNIMLRAIQQRSETQ